MHKIGLSWSVSRATLLYFCKRKYYFSYYTGELSNMGKDIYNLAMTLKKLTSLNMWVGEVVHGMFSDYLHLIQDTTINNQIIDNIKGQTLSDMDRLYHISKHRDYRYGYSEFGLSEHFYKENIDNKFLSAKQDVLKYFDLFLSSDIHSSILSQFAIAKKVFVEPKIPNFESMKMYIQDVEELKGITLRAQPDLGFIVDNNGRYEYYIYDRKTGKIPKNQNKDTVSYQLKVYAYKMLLKLGLHKFDDIDIYCYAVFIRNMQSFGAKIAWEDIYEVQQKIILDVENQKSLLVDADPIKNKALPISYFPKCENANKCKTCRFRILCEKIDKQNIYQANLF